MLLAGSLAAIAPPGQFILASWIFERLMGAVYLVAFISFAVQIKGLAGRNGVMPATKVLDGASSVRGIRRFLLFPTLCWWSASDNFLLGLCCGGAGLSVLCLLGIAPVPVSLLLWMFYLSLLTVCPLFLGYQWDILLLEAGFLTIFISPWKWWVGWPADAAPPSIVLLLLWLLVFRLMFLSGWMKLLSGEAAWRSRKALLYHYETQPLPNRLSWHAHHLPCWFHKVSVAVMFAIELGAPLLIFATPPWRYLAGGAIVGLMLLISATGSYGFFNLLTIVLCVPLMDDSIWRGVLGVAGVASSHTLPRPSGWPEWWLWLVAAVILLLTVEQFTDLFWPRIRLPSVFQKFSGRLRPFMFVNRYGLFAVMTTRRLEIIVEGSNDGLTWRPYEFKWKPGDARRVPGHPAPHQPRLDWQMWFAALSPLHEHPWLVDFMFRLLQGQPAVLSLLRHNPFPDAPPRYVRAQLFDYHFTDRATRRATGAWWRRSWVGLYCPPMALEANSSRADAVTITAGQNSAPAAAPGSGR